MKEWNKDLFPVLAHAQLKRRHTCCVHFEHKSLGSISDWKIKYSQKIVVIFISFFLYIWLPLKAL